MTAGMFTVFLLSGVLLLTSGAVVTIAAQKPYDTQELCEAGAIQVRDFIAMRDDVVAGSWECRPHELPIPALSPEPLAPMLKVK